MHILIIPSEEFVPDNAPLAGIFQYDQACILRNAGHRVSVISVRFRFSLPMLVKAIALRCAGRRVKNETGNYSLIGLIRLLNDKLFKPSKFITRESKDGIQVLRAEAFYLLPPSPARDYRYWVKAGMNAYESFTNKEGAPDVIYSHNALYAGLLALAIKRKFGKPFILQEHSSYYSRNLYHKSLLPRAGKVFEESEPSFAVSHFLANELKKKFAGIKIGVLPDVVDPIFESTQPPNLKLNGFRFLHIGNLISIKRQSDLIQAFADVFRDEADVCLELAGEGEDREKLQQQIYALNMDKRILLTGRLSKAEILRRIDQSHVVCLVSSIETFGVALLEAIFRGVPVIATDCGGLADFVRNYNGILIPKNNVDAMKKALVKIKNCCPQYSREFIRERAIEEFGSASFLRRFEDVIENRYPTKKKSSLDIV
ncbi:MAG: glycosyltransferase [Chitinophagaceae bacterium]|nr:glycosyltransferase [Chitinophagaceae bacterium]